MPLFVADYAEPAASAAGNAYFLACGARALRCSAETGHASLEPLRQAVEAPTDVAPAPLQT